jgi:hypothetical protein
MTEATHGRRRRYAKKNTTKNIKRPGVLGERIRPQAHVPEELRAAARSVQAWNALLEDCHNQAIFARVGCKAQAPIATLLVGGR